MKDQPLSKMLSEMYQHYGPYIDEYIKQKLDVAYSMPIMGETMDATTLNALKKEFTVNALLDVLQGFKTAVRKHV